MATADPAATIPARAGRAATSGEFLTLITGPPNYSYRREGVRLRPDAVGGVLPIGAGEWIATTPISASCVGKFGFPEASARHESLARLRRLARHSTKAASPGTPLISSISRYPDHSSFR
jgi:hypothetical protein